MKIITLFAAEWKHFVRHPFKVLALVLFVGAGVYGLHNGEALFRAQQEEIETIKSQVQEDREEYLANYAMDPIRSGPSSPILALWYNQIYHFKDPSSALVYSIGQAEQYGFYKRITIRSSPFDADMSEEIANPERLQIGSLDFAFVLLFLSPLVLLLLVYNLKSTEHEQGFLSLIQVQVPSISRWLIIRISFYVILLAAVLLTLALYGAVLTGVLSNAPGAFFQLLLAASLYLLFWALLFSLILLRGNTILGNSLSMVGIWMVFTLVIPASVHQWVSLVMPTNLMTELIEVRDLEDEVFEQSDSAMIAQLRALYPKIAESSNAGTAEEARWARNPGWYALVNELMKTGSAPAREDSQRKNTLIESTFWFNPVTAFQNWVNQITGTHYQDYEEYRREVQQLIDQVVKITIEDTWEEVSVDSLTYQRYYEMVQINPNSQ